MSAIRLPSRGRAARAGALLRAFLERASLLALVLRARDVTVREVNFAGAIGSLAERPEQARGSDFFISIHHDSIAAEYLQFWDWDGSEVSHTPLKRGFGIFVSRRNPELATSLRCASAIGATLRRGGFEPTQWPARRLPVRYRKTGSGVRSIPKRARTLA